ncbi:hypothetical protein RGU41_13260 [Cryobacterium sp. 10C3]|nr:hypothetical protein [Cryobacterium sp. 10C3]MDY7557622.1 hypothetical protein [Cryobacterium sp. 10C3]
MAGKIGMLAVALILLSAVALALMLSGCGSAPGARTLAAAPTQLPATPMPTPKPASKPASTPTAAPPAVPLLTGASADIRSVQAQATVAPVRIRIEALGIDMDIEAVGLGDTGGMGLPKNPAIAAWYKFGPAPASAAGATVIAAHVDSLEYDIGPFSRLASAARRERRSCSRWPTAASGATASHPSTLSSSPTCPGRRSSTGQGPPASPSSRVAVNSTTRRDVTSPT